MANADRPLDSDTVFLIVDTAFISRPLHFSSADDAAWSAAGARSLHETRTCLAVAANTQDAGEHLDCARGSLTTPSAESKR
jgi:hypothetical protein